MKQTKKNAGKTDLFSGWRSMKFFDGQELSRLDWIITGLVLFVLFFCCAHPDIRLTGNRSFNIYQGLKDFYKNSYEQSQNYWANYLPSTFLLYAIWNLPLKLTGHIPPDMRANSIINVLWYKALPVLFYIATAHIMYLIGKKIGFGEKKSRLLKFAFLIFPIGVFSQFIFSQYDVFTVFFMALGLYFYVSGGLWRFALMFGIAITFKYHAAMYFLVLLVLREKKIRNMLKYGIAAALPFLIEVLPYWNDVYFRRHVFGFVMLRTASDTVFGMGFFQGINMMAAAAAFALVWAYQKKTSGEQELLAWASFFTVLMSLALFGFSGWNPQWLLMLVPYVLLNIFMNENGNLLVMITNVLILGLYIYTSNTMVGEAVIFGGVLKYTVYEGELPVRMWDIYRFHNENILLSAIWIVLVCYVVFGQPKFLRQPREKISRGLVWQLRCAFIFGVLAYMLPLSLVIAESRAGKEIYLNNITTGFDAGNYVLISEDSSPVQEIKAEGPRLSSIRVCAHVTEQKVATIHFAIRNKETGEIVYEAEKEAFDFAKDRQYYYILKEPVEVEEGQTYLLEFSSDDLDEDDGFGLYCTAADSKKLILEEEETEDHTFRSLRMKIIGYR